MKPWKRKRLQEELYWERRSRECAESFAGQYPKQSAKDVKQHDARIGRMRRKMGEAAALQVERSDFPLY